jgi:multidrug efflux pump subunit AcrB
VVAVFLLRFVPQQFFPASDRPELTMDMTLPQSASIHATQAHVERMEALLKDDPDIDHYSTYVGRGAIRFILTLNVQLANPFFAQFVIVAKDVEARARLHTKLEKLLAEEFPTSSATSPRSNSGRRSAGRCSTGCRAPTRTRCAASRRNWPTSWDPSRARGT